MGKITRTWSLMGECWQVLMADKSLLVFPLLSGICCLMLLASFAVPLYLTHGWVPLAHDATPARHAAYYGSLFAFYVANYFVVVFFNTAIVACAAERMTGGHPTIGDGLRAATGRLHLIAGWALISATVGLVLRVIEDRSDKVGAIVAGLLGMAWTVISFLVVPAMVIENKGPFAALSESTRLLKQTWGEQLVSNFGFGMIFFLLSLPAFAVMISGFWLHLGMTIDLTLVLLEVVYLIALSLVHSAIQAIFQTALYLYARDGRVPDGFQSDTLESALGR